jgi:hypothetical protein
MRRFAVHILLAATMILGLPACSGPQQASQTEEQVAPENQGPTTWPEVETLDVDQYPDEKPDLTVVMEHYVPAALMNSTADDGKTVELDGYRVQVFSSAEREEAVRVEDEVHRWLNGLTDAQRTTLGLPQKVAVYSIYRQPLYRIRVGDFERREDASRLVPALQRQFPGALVVPDRITVIR